MSLIPVSSNVFVNSCKVDALEQRDLGGTTAYFVCIGEKEYLLTIPLQEFIKSMDDDDDDYVEQPQQIWAG